MIGSPAEILREYGPFAGVDQVHGVTFDGRHVWFASGERLNAFDPASGEVVHSIGVAGHAGTAFDGRHLYQLAGDRIHKIDPQMGRVLATILAPGDGCWGSPGPKGRSGWGSIGTGRSIKSIPKQGRFFAPSSLTASSPGVTWIDGELWHGTWEDEESDLRRVEPRTGAVLERLELPRGMAVSGLESDGGDRFFCGGGTSGKIRAVRRPRRISSAASGDAG